MPFRTKLDFSSNRQIKQFPGNITELSGGTSFGVPFSALTTGPDLTTSAITQSYSLVASSYSGNSGTTIFTWGVPEMSLGESQLSALTPSNSATTQNVLIFTAATTTVIDGNTVALTYTGVTYPLVVVTMDDLGGGDYSGTLLTNTVSILSAGTLDYTGRTIWVDVSGYTRTQDLIVTKNPQVGYVLTCIDSEGKVEWQPTSGGSSGSTTSVWTGSTGASSAVLSGSTSLASGDYAVAEGNATIASGNYAHAGGSGTTATGAIAHAEGYGNLAAGQASHVEGAFTTATSDATGGHAEGISTRVLGDGAHAEGYQTTATADYGSHAEGSGTTAYNFASHAEGSGSISGGIAAHAEGIATTASGNYTHAEGNTTTAIGNAAHAEGYLTIASGDYSHSSGSGSTASGNVSHAEGRGTAATGLYTHSEGQYSWAFGEASHAEGFTTTAFGDYSHAEGTFNVASGNGSHAEGMFTLASNDGSHSEGNTTTASGQWSHAEGSATTASATVSHAQGQLTIASGIYSHAGGFLSTASGGVSFVHGSGSTASGIGTIALGNNITASADNSTYVVDLYITNLVSTDPLATNGSGKVIAGVSDARLKDNVQTIGNTLSLINQLRPVSFTYKPELELGNAVHFGLIAQEVQSIFPELVKPRAGDEEHFNVSYIELIPLIIKAINELSTGTTTQGGVYLETQTILAEDNDVQLNYSGNQQTAIGGGIRVLHAIGQNQEAEFITDENGNWVTNNDIKAKALTIPLYTPTSSNDNTGSEGNITRDEDYIYIKTNSKWKRTKLEEF